MLSHFFIDRPVFASVISIVIVLVGLAAMTTLPVAQYPEITPPVVTVTANYTGASAEVLANTVAAPVEQQINGVEEMLYLGSTSTSSNGQVRIDVTFAIGADIDRAVINVNNRIRVAEPLLPQEVQRLGVNAQKRSTNFLQILALQSPEERQDPLFISNYAAINIVDALKRIPGVGDVQIFGAQVYSMRIWLQPNRMAELGVTTSDVAAAIREQNSQFAAGQIGQEPIRDQQLTYTVTTKGRLVEPEEFGNIIVRADANAALLRLKEFSRIELGAQSYDAVGKLNGRPATLLAIYLQPGANALATARSVADAMRELSENFPSGIVYSVPYDTTVFVGESIREVVKTFAEALVLVVLVVFVFLQNWRATLIPILAIPVSLIGTFAGMYLLGFSINTLTLFGMVLAIGIVVDDAIVVLENVDRVMSQEGLPPRDAAIKAMREVSGPVIALVLVLCAVFIPVGFLGGIAGQLYQQFAITIAVSVVISGIVALTLSPALSAALLKPERREPGRVFRGFNCGFDRATQAYTRVVGFFNHRWPLSLAALVLATVMTVILFRVQPTSFIPEEDQGYYIAMMRLPDGTALDPTDAVASRVVEIARSNPAVEDVVSITGFDLLGGGQRSSAATLFVRLKPWAEREAHARELIREMSLRANEAVRQGLVLAFNPPAIPGLGTTGGFELYVQNRGEGGPDRLAQVTEELVAGANRAPELSGVSTTFRPAVPQLYIELDRERAKTYGVGITSVGDTLQALFGSLYVNDFNQFGRTFRVQLQAEPEFRSAPQDIGRVYVRSSRGEMIPLSSLLTVREIAGPDTIERYLLFPAAKVIGNAAPGYSSGDAIAAIERVAAEALPEDFSFAWTGQAYQEIETGGAAGVVFAAGVVMVFLILAAMYERWTLPVAVLLAVPFALLGAVLAIWLRGLENDVYFQIGLVTLIALAARNAILIVEFAVLERDRGKSVYDAAVSAARLRFRPILMTSLAFILGVVPLALSTGAGAAGRHSIGTGVIGGMLAATFIATLFIPSFYVALSRRKEPNPGRSQSGPAGNSSREDAS